MFSKQKVFFKTFGCRTNVFDSQVMMSKLEDFDITLNEKEANVVVINSCTVTNSADTTARSYINGLNKLPNKPRVIFTGCGEDEQKDTTNKEGSSQQNEQKQQN